MKKIFSFLFIFFISILGAIAIVVNAENVKDVNALNPGLIYPTIFDDGNDGTYRSRSKTITADSGLPKIYMYLSITDDTYFQPGGYIDITYGCRGTFEDGYTYSFIDYCALYGTSSENVLDTVYYGVWDYRDEYYHATVSVPVTDENGHPYLWDVHSGEHYSINTAGRGTQGTTDFLVPNFDYSAPKLSVAGESTTYAGSRNITLSGTDSNIVTSYTFSFNKESGIAAYTCDGSKWISSTASTYTCYYSSNMDTAVVGVRDRAGKETTKTVNVYVNDSAPKWSITGVNSYENIFYVKPSTAVHMQLSSASAIYQYSTASNFKYGWSTSSSTAPSYTTPTLNATSTSVKFDVTSPTSDGTKYLWIYYAGKSSGGLVSVGPYYNNVTAWTSKAIFKFVVDGTAPTVSRTSTYVSGNSIVSASVSDTNYLETSMYYYKTKTTTSTFCPTLMAIGGNTCTITSDVWEFYKTLQTNNVSMPLPNAATLFSDGTDVVKFIARDKAGNTNTVYWQLEKVGPLFSDFTGGSTTWQKSATVSITGARDAVSGLHAKAYCFVISDTAQKIAFAECDGGGWGDNSSIEVTTTTNGYIHAYLRDEAFNFSYAGALRIMVDSTRPDLSTSGTSTSWTASNRTITLYGSDDQSGIAQYTCDGSTWVDSTSSSHSCVFSYSVRTATVGVKDGVGNVAYIENLNVYVDKTVPSLSVTGASTTWTTTSRNITLNGSDSHSGVVQYTCDGSTWVNSTSSSYVCTFSSSIKTTTVGVKDGIGLTKTETVNVYLDTSNPGVLVTGDSTTWTTGNRTIKLSGVDNLSGISAYYCNGSWKASTSTSYDCVFSTTTTTATVGVKDGAGRSVTQSVNVYVDKDSPKISVSGASTTWNTSSRTLTFTGDDVGSGIAAYYCNDAWVSSTSTSYSCKYSSSKKTATVGIKDVAGRSATKTVNVYVDTTNPTLTVSGESISWIKTNRTITLSASEDVSGITQYTCNGTSWTDSTSTSRTCTFSSSIKTATVGVKVGSGRSTTKTINVYVDKTLPTASVTAAFESSFVDLANGKVNIPFTPGDAHSTVSTVTSNNSGTYSSGKITFPITSISSNKLTFTYNVTDVAGNVKTGDVTIDTTLSYDSTLAQAVKTAMVSNLTTGLILSTSNNNRQVSYTLNDTASTSLAYLSYFGINPDANTVNIKYVFATQNLAANLNDYADFAKPTTHTTLKNTIYSPMGQKGTVYLVLLFEDMGIHVGNGLISGVPASSSSGSGGGRSGSTLTPIFDKEITQIAIGAGLGEDGTVVSFSDDATSSMAVTLGSSNIIEKRDVYGNLEWEKTITSSGKIELKKVINNEYGILVLGETTSGSINGTSYPLKGGKDILVIRLDKEGNILFTNVIGSEGADSFIAADMNENKISLLVRSEEYTALHTMKLDGSEAKENVIAGNGIYPNDISLLANKTVVIGSIESETMAIEEEVTIEPKSAYVQLFVDEQLQWTRMLRSSSDVTFTTLDLDEQNIYVLGHTTSSIVHDDLGATKFLDTYGEEDSFIIKYDYDSNMDQISVVGGEGNDKFNQILIDDERIIIAGISSSSDITASHFLNTNTHINKIGDTDTLIIFMDKQFVIYDGMNLSYKEGSILQEIGINQYTEQLMILSSDSVSTQRIVEDTLRFKVLYEDGILKIDANEELESAILFDGTAYYEIGDGIELPYGAYEVTVTSTTGQTYTEVIGISPKVEHSILPMIALFASIVTLGVLTVLVIRKYKKEFVQA